MGTRPCASSSLWVCIRIKCSTVLCVSVWATTLACYGGIPCPSNIVLDCSGVLNHVQRSRCIPFAHTLLVLQYACVRRLQDFPWIKLLAAGKLLKLLFTVPPPQPHALPGLPNGRETLSLVEEMAAASSSVAFRQP